MAPVGTAPATAQQQTCAVGDVRPVLRSLVSQVRDLVGGLDPEAVPAAQVVEVWDLCGELARLSMGAQTLVARRVAEAGVYKAAGARDTAEFLALRSGVSKSAMGQMLATSHRLAHQPVVVDAVRRGALSVEQAHAVSDAAGTDLSEQERLVGYARGRSLKELRDESLRAKAVADPAPEQTRRRQIEERHFRSGTGADGRWWFKGEGPPEDRARFEAALNPFIETAFRQARGQGRRESRDVLAYDALQALARHAHQEHPATPGDSGDDRKTNPNTGGGPSCHDDPGHPHPGESGDGTAPSQPEDVGESRPQGATGWSDSPGCGDRAGGREPGSREDAAAGRWRSRETADSNDSPGCGIPVMAMSRVRRTGTLLDVQDLRGPLAGTTVPATGIPKAAPVVVTNWRLGRARIRRTISAMTGVAVSAMANAAFRVATLLEARGLGGPLAGTVVPATGIPKAAPVVTVPVVVSRTLAKTSLLVAVRCLGEPLMETAICGMATTMAVVVVANQVFTGATLPEMSRSITPSTGTTISVMTTTVTAAAVPAREKSALRAATVLEVQCLRRPATGTTVPLRTMVPWRTMVPAWVACRRVEWAGGSRPTRRRFLRRLVDGRVSPCCRFCVLIWLLYNGVACWRGSCVGMTASSGPA